MRETEAVETVTLSCPERGIAVLSLQDQLNNNTFTEPVVEALLQTRKEIEQDRSVRVSVTPGL